jgi:hypothetical protein
VNNTHLLQGLEQWQRFQIYALLEICKRCTSMGLRRNTTFFKIWQRQGQGQSKGDKETNIPSTIPHATNKELMFLIFNLFFH